MFLPTKLQLLAGAQAWKAARSPRATGPGAPEPIILPSMATTGMTSVVAPVMKASFAEKASAMVNWRSSMARFFDAAISNSRARVMPLRMQPSAGRVTMTPASLTIQALLDEPSVT